MIVALRGMDPARLSEPAGPDDGDERAASRAAIALRPQRAEPADPAGDDGRRRHARVQLPGAAAAARALHLRRRRRRVHRARGRDGGRLGRRRARDRRPRPGQRAAARRRRRSASASSPCSPRSAPTLPLEMRRAGPARLRERDLRRRRQLDPAARRGAGDARAGDGALLGRLPRLDPDRRARSSAGSRRSRARAPAWSLGGVAAIAARRRRRIAFARSARPGAGAVARRRPGRGRRAASGPGRGRGTGRGCGSASRGSKADEGST